MSWILLTNFILKISIKFSSYHFLESSPFTVFAILCKCMLSLTNYYYYFNLFLLDWVEI